MIICTPRLLPSYFPVGEEAHATYCDTGWSSQPVWKLRRKDQTIVPARVRISNVQPEAKSLYRTCNPGSTYSLHSYGWSQWSLCLKRGYAAARLMRLWVRIPLQAWMSVSCECCMLSGRCLCDGPITRPEKSYRVWCVGVIVKPQ